MSTTTTATTFLSTAISNISQTARALTHPTVIYTTLGSWNETDTATDTVLSGTQDTIDLSGPQGINKLSQVWTDIIHSLAVVSLAVSILFSLGTVCYLFLSERGKSLWNRKIAERLVVYLAFCDLFYSLEHIIDHTYILIHDEFPPEVMCVVLGFLLQQFAVLQGILVVFTALNAFSLVVREKGIVLGRYDWRLIGTSMGVPAVMGVILASTGMLGPSEAWCFTDKRREAAEYVDMAYGLSFVAIFVIDIACYSLVWYKIKKVSGLMTSYQKDRPSADSTGGQRNLTAARTMCIFIVAYIGQWFAYMTYSIWSLFKRPPVELLALTTVVTNMGGVFNCIAYTLVRKRNKQNKQDRNTRRGTANGSHASSPTKSFSGASSKNDI